jgi:hypothetical protein
MQYFAIRKIGTDEYLPMLDRKRLRGGGYTHTEPTPIDKAIPRLFRRQSDAKIALTYWLKGKARVKWETVGYTEDAFGFDPKEDAGVEFMPDPTRRREDFEVVSMCLFCDAGHEPLQWYIDEQGTIHVFNSRTNKYIKQYTDGRVETVDWFASSKEGEGP